MHIFVSNLSNVSVIILWVTKLVELSTIFFNSSWMLKKFATLSNDQDVKYAEMIWIDVQLYNWKGNGFAKWEVFIDSLFTQKSPFIFKIYKQTTISLWN